VNNKLGKLSTWEEIKRSFGKTEADGQAWLLHDPHTEETRSVDEGTYKDIWKHCVVLKPRV
jgi:hypothetical protein